MLPGAAGTVGFAGFAGAGAGGAWGAAGFGVGSDATAVGLGGGSVLGPAGLGPVLPPGCPGGSLGGGFGTSSSAALPRAPITLRTTPFAALLGAGGRGWTATAGETRFGPGTNGLATAFVELVLFIAFAIEGSKDQPVSVSSSSGGLGIDCVLPHPDTTAA